MSKHYLELEKTFKRMHSFSHLGSIVGWDEAVNMPEGSGESRADALSELTAFLSETMKDPKLKDLLDSAQTDTDLNEWQSANLNSMRRSWEKSNVLPVEFVRKQSQTNIKCNQAWRRYRKENNWKDFSPLLQEVVNIAVEEANIRSDYTGKSKYDSMLDLYEPELTTDAVDRLFSPLREKLPNILNQAMEKQSAFKRPLGPFKVEQQKNLGLDIMQSLGFDFNRGRLDISHHPFCGGVPEDVRITTRYNEEDFTESLMGIIHETGHARYEQNLPSHWISQPLGHAQGMAIHEGQSLFFEMQMGRSPEFITYSLPLMKKYFNITNDADIWTQQNMTSLYQEVKPGLIRVDADEVTYPFHVIIRYEIEKDLLDGKVKVSDLPDIWDAKMTEYLGLSTNGDYANGVMQDVHWPSGALGYFPTYTLGAMVAAQMFSQLQTECPDINGQIAQGNFSTVNTWLKEKIWSHGSRYNYNTLLKSATGKELSSGPFLAHLEQRYL